jgi:hypothetical protein
MTKKIIKWLVNFDTHCICSAEKTVILGLVRGWISFDYLFSFNYKKQNFLIDFDVLKTHFSLLSL